MLVNRWTNTGALFYDFAINGVPFLSAASQEFPYVRRAAAARRDQIDVSGEAGEQTLAGWWLRSQGSFDLGCGAKFLDGFGNSDPIRRRAALSYGVNLFEEGKVTLLKEAVNLSSYSADSGWIINYSSGAVFAAGLNVYYRTDSSTAAVTWGGNGTTDVPSDATTDGTKIYIASFRNATSDGGVYETDSSGTNRRMYSGTNLKAIEFAKDRLIAASGPHIYVMPIVATNDTAYPAPLFTHSNANFSFESFAEGPNAVYAAGTSAGGNYSAIYALTVQDESGTPTLQTPVIVAEMPRGESINTIASYLGTYLLIATSKGFRVGIISGDGSLIIGALMLEDDDTGAGGFTRGIAVSGKYAYVGGWCNAHGVTPNNAGNTHAIGIFRVDLSKPTNADLLTFAWQRDISYQTTVTDGTVLGVAMYGVSGRACYLTKPNSSSTVSLVVESASTVRLIGWVDTPVIRFDTLDNKWFATISLFRSGTGIARVYDKDNLSAQLGSTDGVALPNFTFTGTHNGASKIGVAYRIELDSLGGAVGPTLSGYQVKAAPRNVQQMEIIVPLMAMPREKAPNQPVVQRNVWERLSALETLQASGEAVLFQDLRTGEEKMVFVSDVRFISTSIPESYRDQRDGGHGGVISLTLTTVGIAVP